MKRFFVNNWRAIFHFFAICECFFIFWIGGMVKLSSDHLLINIFILGVSFFTAEVSIKIMGFGKMVEELKKDLEKEEKDKLK